MQGRQGKLLREERKKTGKPGRGIKRREPAMRKRKTMVAQ